MCVEGTGVTGGDRRGSHNKHWRAEKKTQQWQSLDSIAPWLCAYEYQLWHMEGEPTQAEWRRCAKFKELLDLGEKEQLYSHTVLKNARAFLEDDGGE